MHYLYFLYLPLIVYKNSWLISTIINLYSSTNNLIVHANNAFLKLLLQSLWKQDKSVRIAGVFWKDLGEFGSKGSMYEGFFEFFNMWICCINCLECKTTKLIPWTHSNRGIKPIRILSLLWYETNPLPVSFRCSLIMDLWVLLEQDRNHFFFRRFIST